MPFQYLKLVVRIFPRFCSLAASLSINLETEKQNVISKLKFKIVFWHIFLSPIKFSEKKRPLAHSLKTAHFLIKKFLGESLGGGSL